MPASDITQTLLNIKAWSDVSIRTMTNREYYSNIESVEKLFSLVVDIPPAEIDDLDLPFINH